MISQDTFSISTEGRGTTEITHLVDELVSKSGIACGVCHVFIYRTHCETQLFFHVV